MKIGFGYPETLQATGAILILADHVATGWIFCALGLLGIAFRFGMRVQEQEKQKRDAEKLFSSIGEVYKTITAAVANANIEKNELH